jgi:hypothetical protein
MANRISTITARLGPRLRKKAFIAGANIGLVAKAALSLAY